jgi:hypothetical protein
MRTILIWVLVFATVLVPVDRAIYAGAIYLRNPSVVFFGDSRTHHNFHMPSGID